MRITRRILDRKWLWKSHRGLGETAPALASQGPRAGTYPAARGPFPPALASLALDSLRARRGMDAAAPKGPPLGAYA